LEFRYHRAKHEVNLLHEIGSYTSSTNLV